MQDGLHRKYQEIRREYPWMQASQAILWARHELATDELERRIDWTPTGTYGGGPGIYVGTDDETGAELVIYADDEPYDWGDCEPTEQERRDLEVIGVGVRIAGETEVLESVWGIGYTSGDCWREACSFALSSGYLEIVADELTERAEMAARGVVTR